jgi:hypothetical protein
LYTVAEKSEVIEQGKQHLANLKACAAKSALHFLSDAAEFQAGAQAGTRQVITFPVIFPLETIQPYQ